VSESTHLPSYEAPPVNEVVCGMKYHAPTMLRVPHIGVLWEKLRTEYPVIQHAAPIGSSAAEFATDPITGLPLPRVWFINELDDQLIQFQLDRFYFNWRHKEGLYPRYPYVIKQFEKTMDTIEGFFEEFKLGKLNPIEYELSYINHFEKNREWDEIDDLSKILTDFFWNKRTGRFLSIPIKISWQTEFELPDKKGHLFVNLKSALRTDDNVPLFILELVARGKGNSTDKKTVREWYDIAHEWIVNGFTDLTSSEAHKMWKRIK
jgi:uncharacterized protein (TIGR04255 family)